MNNWAVVTVGTRNYLHFTRALEKSVRSAHPDARIIACVVDPVPVENNGQGSAIEILPFEALKIPRAKRFLFQYTPFELTCALKSYVLQHVFRETKLEKLLYLDGDIQVYGGLTPLLKKLDTDHILLTPHLLRPKSLELPDRWEMDLLDTGVFNGGFMGLRKSETSLAMLEWWRQRMEKWCTQEHQHDQKWLNGLPALFDHVHIERGAQYNVAPWNTSERNIAGDGQGRMTVDGQPVVFFHYASIDPGQTKVLSKISRRPLAEEPVAVRRCYHEYVARLLDVGLEQCRSWGYEYSRLADGTAIEPAWRELIRKDHPKFLSVEDPFQIPAGDFRKAAFGVNVSRQTQRVRRAFKV
jgi:hypothetical protein